MSNAQSHSEVHQLRTLRDNVSDDVQQHLVSLAFLHAMTAGGKVMRGIQAGMQDLIAESQSHEIRLTAALEAMEAGRTDEAIQLLGADH